LDGRTGWLQSISWCPYGGTVNAAQKISDTNWHYFVMTYSGGGATSFYVDGVPGVGYDDTWGERNTILTGQLEVGMSSDTSGGVGVYLDEVAIWDRALDPSEAELLYNNASGRSLVQ
jgi:hypothetical protein